MLSRSTNYREKPLILRAAFGGMAVTPDANGVGPGRPRRAREPGGAVPISNGRCHGRRAKPARTAGLDLGGQRAAGAAGSPRGKLGSWQGRTIGRQGLGGERAVDTAPWPGAPEFTGGADSAASNCCR